MKTPTTFTRTLIQTADSELDRITGPLFAEQRAKAIYYQSFSFACLAMLYGFCALVGELSNFELICVAMTDGIFAGAAFMSVMSLTGGQGNTSAVTHYNYYLNYCEVKCETEYEANKDLLGAYDIAIKQAKDVLAERGKALRLINKLVLFGIVAFCLSVSVVVM